MTALMERLGLSTRIETYQLFVFMLSRERGPITLVHINRTLFDTGMMTIVRYGFILEGFNRRGEPIHYIDQEVIFSMGSDPVTAIMNSDGIVRLTTWEEAMLYEATQLVNHLNRVGIEVIRPDREALLPTYD